jgi:regulator of sigma E protease
MNYLITMGTFFYNILLIFIGLLGVNFLIAFHELGHYLFCKLFKIRTPSFSIGFGPYLFSKKIKDTVFALSAIPFGGYVEIAGLQEVGQGTQQDALARDNNSFFYKPYYQKILVLLGGILFNIIFAYTVFAALFYWGVQKTPLLYPFQAQPIITSVVPGSPADQAHLQIHDKIIALNHTPLNNSIITFSQLLPTTYPSSAIITIEREGQIQDITVNFELSANRQKQGFLGVEFEVQETQPLSFIDAVKKGINATHMFIAATFISFKNMFTQRTMKGLGGPLMIIQQTVKGASQGAKIFFLLLALISINLAVLNILPLPILDGGQVVFYTIEALIRRPLPEKIKLTIHYVCWLALIFLAIVLSPKDLFVIAKPFLG